MPFNPREIQRLNDAILSSRRKLIPYRENRVEAIRQFVGSHYSDDGASDRVPLNLLELAVSIYVRQLAAKAPQVMVNTPHRLLKPSAANLEAAMNFLIKKIRFGKTLQRVTVDALFGMGIMKVGLAREGIVDIDGVAHAYGQPFADAVSLDDWVHDMSARSWDEVQFCGNQYRVPFDTLMNSGMFDGPGMDRIRPSDPTEIDELGQERASSISQGSEANQDQFREYVNLWDIWLPRENLLITLPAGGGGSTLPLRIVEWDGPERGPYHILSFSDVPSNTMPLPPVATWRDMHELANRLFTKIGRQADRQKTLLGVRNGGAADANRIIDGNDGETIAMDDPNNAREYTFGGVDPRSLAFLIQLKDMFAYLGGNLDSLGGLSPMSQTVGQDQLLAQNASKRVSDMQDREIDFTADVVRDLAFYLWTDPLIELPLVRRIKGVDLDIPVTYTPEQREGQFLDYNIDIQPYSMQHESPGMKLQTLVQVFTQFIGPYIPLLQQQGITVNFESLLRTIAKYSNMTELDDILSFYEAPQSYVMPPVGEMPMKASNTHRTYERINRPGATSQGKDAAMIQQLLGGGLQDGERATIGRPTG